MSFSGLDISVSGMLASQVGLDVTSNNIANANTKGYSRKQVGFVEGAASQTGQSKMRLLTGVVVDTVDRIRNSFLDQQVRQQAANTGRDKQLADLMIAMNDILGEPSDSGLTAKANEFFQAASDWAANPELEAARTVFINSANTLTSAFNQIDQSVGLLKSNLDATPSGTIKTSVKELNEKLQLLAEVHKKVLSLDAREAESTQLKDQRDLLLDEISGILNVTIVRDGGGNFNKLTMSTHASEAKVSSSNFFPNYDSAISGITSSANTLVLTVNNGAGTSTGPFTVNFEVGSTPREMVDKINKTFNASGGRGSVASIDSSGKLVLQTALVDNAENSTAAAITIGASSTALTPLGLTAGTTSGTAAQTVVLLDSQGLDYTFDTEPGFNAVGSNPGKLILRTNDGLQTPSGYIDSFSGVLGGLFEASNKAIPEMRQSLSDFAMSIKNSVNKILTLGQTATGSAGAELFTGTTSGNFAVNTNVISNNSLLTQGKTGSPSDGSIAAEVSELFFGTNNIVSNNTKSEKVYIDSESSSTVSSKIPIVPGQSITVHADGLIDDDGSAVNAGTNGFGGGSLMQLEFVDASGTVIGTAVDFPASAGAPTDRVTYTGTVPASAAFIRVKMNSSFNDSDLTNNTGHFGVSIIQGTEDDSSTNFNNKIADIVGDFGTRGSVAISKQESSSALYDSLDNRRQSISGVSIEEETASLIKFQNSFSANARVISIWNQIFDSILSIVS